MKPTKRKAIYAELRKESKTFDGYLKYEITVDEGNGEISKIPAYGKDLQDALSRVVHDRKIERVLPVFKKIPDFVWPIFWFIGIGFISLEILKHRDTLGDWTGLIFTGAILVFATFSLAIANYFKIRNRPTK